MDVSKLINYVPSLWGRDQLTESMSYNSSTWEGQWAREGQWAAVSKKRSMGSQSFIRYYKRISEGTKKREAGAKS